jgi:hypothetical protein
VNLLDAKLQVLRQGEERERERVRGAIKRFDCYFTSSFPFFCTGEARTIPKEAV